MLKEIQDCFRADKFLFSKHARDEMESEEFGEIKEKEVHADPEKWVDFERRKT